LILALYGYTYNLSLTNQDFKINAVSIKTDVSKYKDDLQEILFLVKRINTSKNIPSEIFSQINNLGKIMEIQNAAVQDKTLTINGTVNLKDMDNLKMSVSKISSNSEIKEIKTAGDFIEIEVIINFL
jgi:hypothetical protein